MVNLRELSAQVACGDTDQIRALGEALRDEAERLARSNPGRLTPLFAALREAGLCDRRFRPWALWIEGGVEQLLGRPRRAMPLLERAARAFRLVHDDHRAARVDIALMDALACMGRHRRAARRGRRALNAFSAVHDRPHMVSALLNLGGLADAQDRVGAALKLWLQARRLVTETDLLRRAMIANSLGVGYQAQGRFLEANAQYAEAVTLFEMAGAISSAMMPRLGLAEVKALSGRVSDALAEIQEIDRRCAALGDDYLHSEAALLLARIELDLGHYKRARHIAEGWLLRHSSRSRLDDLARFSSLRAVASAREDPDSIGTTVAAAEEALRRAGMPLSAAVMRVELSQAGVGVPMARLGRDASLLQQAGLRPQADLARLAHGQELWRSGKHTAARRIYRDVAARRHASVWPRIEALRLLGEDAGADNLQEAITYLRRAIRVAESVRGRLACESDRKAFVGRVMSAYEKLVELLLSRGDARSRREAFSVVARVKSRGLLEALDRRRDVDWHDSPEIVQRWNAMRRELSAMLASLETRRDEHSRYAPAIVEDRIRTVARQLEDLEIEIARSTTPLGAVLGSFTEPNLRPLLRPREVFLEAFFTASDLVLFNLSGNGLGVRVHQGCRHQVEVLVETIRFHLSKAVFGARHLEAAGKYLVEQVRSALSALGELILADLPTAGALDRVFIAPHGALHHVPVAALEIGGAPLIERCPVSVVPGSGVLARLLERPAPCPHTLGVAGAGSPCLPEIEREISEISAALPNAHTTADARIGDVLHYLRTCEVVHVAGHGAFQPLLPAGSGIRLGDGWLTALDLVHRKISARLVTMGVCASGEVAVGRGEELMGVIRTLLAGGVQTAVLSPGALDDQIARRAARRFYASVFAIGAGQALRDALLEIRAEHPHPALWAALQLYGNSRPWEPTP
jgi:tetratricopeptide (TPR) repeat protein